MAAAHPAAEGGSPALATQLEQFARLDEMLDFWKRTHGMHTVHEWITNYQKHPGGWGALLMIHGVQELTGRLRTKVENYAIYSALFLSMSIALIASPADFIFEPCDDGDVFCFVGKRVFVYGLSIGTALHMLCILLAMAFVNALNEAARDSDVYRLLAKGGGFTATQKCAVCFNIGCATDFCAVIVSTCEYLDIVEPLALYAALLAIALMVYVPTSESLYSSCSIVSYWRKDRGGNPDPDDPFDLQLPERLVKQRATMNNFMRANGGWTTTERSIF
ncbi:unnamed protein product [Prorocentrum cordatum]|uniref:Protein S-acyltransferase n=1 Tax=Prorocentrum cordatum TaxID=2364126 RepID=A0ABN9XYY9_9DINO|nr:unnamed protein product [Polarella glacialis]